MFTLHEQPPEFYQWNRAARKILHELLTDADSKEPPISVEKDSHLEPPHGTESMYWVKAGFLKLEKGAKVLFFYEAGDLVFLPRWQGKGVAITADYPSVLVPFPLPEFFAFLHEKTERVSQWNEYIGLKLRMFTELISQGIPEDVSLSPERRVFPPGRLIIEEGMEPKEVFTLLNGSADVFVRGKKVGSVKTGEIFGAISATLQTMRSASVRATTPCIVSAVRKEDFLSVIRTHPKTLLLLIEDMARIIKTQNEKIASA